MGKLDDSERQQRTKTPVSMTERITKMRETQRKETAIRVKMANSQRSVSLNGSMKRSEGILVKDKQS